MSARREDIIKVRAIGCAGGQIGGTMVIHERSHGHRYGILLSKSDPAISGANRVAKGVTMWPRYECEPSYCASRRCKEVAYRVEQGQPAAVRL